MDGSTFKMRVFPLEARQEKRIVLSYTQRLPPCYGQRDLSLPAGHSLQVVRDWSFHARVKDGAGHRLATARRITLTGAHGRRRPGPDGDREDTPSSTATWCWTCSTASSRRARRCSFAPTDHEDD